MNVWRQHMRFICFRSLNFAIVAAVIASILLVRNRTWVPKSKRSQGSAFVSHLTEFGKTATEVSRPRSNTNGIDRSLDTDEIRIYQAEDYMEQSGCREESNVSGFTGDGFMNCEDNGSFVQWNISVVADGEYRLKFRYAVNDPDGRPCDLYVQGTKMDHLDFNDTGNWSVWEEETVNVQIIRGNNTDNGATIRVQSVKGGPYFDFMQAELITTVLDGDNGNLTSMSEGNNLMLLAYYYPWYIRDNWERHDFQDTPLLGLYGTDEPQVAHTHNEWAQQAGIDAWVVSWWGKDHLTTRHFAEGMLMSDNIDKMKFCMLYESKGALQTRNFNHGALGDLISDLKTIRDSYFHHPSYLKVDGRHVVVLYITRTWENFQPWMINTIEEEVGDVFLIADEPFYGEQKNVKSARNGVKNNGQPVFEAYTTYNMYESARVRRGETATDFMFREGEPIFEHWSKDTVFFPNVMPQYHDFRGHEPLVGNADQFREQLNAFSCLARPVWYQQGTYPDMIFVTSFNEWWEGSQVEPDDSEKWGLDFFDVLKDFKERGPMCSMTETEEKTNGRKK